MDINVYNIILDELKRIIPLNTEKELAEYLQTLQPFAKTFWNEYQKSNVKVDYSLREYQIIYLLRYFPRYTIPVPHSFYKNKEKPTITSFFDNTEQDIHLFGAGSCPEIIGYLGYVNKYYAEKQYNFTIYAYDIAINSWELSRTLTQNTIVRSYLNNNKIVFHNKELDIAQPFDITINTQRTQLIIFQNCFNEIPETEHKIVIDNIKKIFISLPVNSILLIIDLKNYSIVDKLFEGIKEEIKLLPQNLLISRAKSIEIKGDDLLSYNPLPIVVKENLLTGKDKLKPKKNVEFSYLMFAKTLT
jgi:hypothetical protein